jgi:hypothetical protein
MQVKSVREQIRVREQFRVTLKTPFDVRNEDIFKFHSKM